MATFDLTNAEVLVVGAGIMGAGIAQVAAQAGHRVMLFDAREGAAAQAKGRLQASLEALVSRGKLQAADVEAALSRIVPIARLSLAAKAALVVEAIVENLDAKRVLLRELESFTDEGCVLATNTSSISVTALANGMTHPGRLVGMHFFNPVPVMKLVEVVSGLRTEPAAAQAVFDISRSWGKVPVHARSTPGFIVNRIARPYYAEALALLLERAASAEAIDACLRGAGFRMGPCELMDLIGHDTNFAVTQSVYDANFGDKRYAPSLIQREMVDGGLLGRKSGQGFYTYPTPDRPAAAALESQPLPRAAKLVLLGDGVLVRRWEQALQGEARPFGRLASSPWSGIEVDGAQIRLTDGRTAMQLAADEGLRDVALFDLAVMGDDAPHGSSLAWTACAAASAPFVSIVPQWLAAAGFRPQRVGDAPGLIAARTIALLIDEAAGAVRQGVCNERDADHAMKLGVNYPAGPFEWLARWDAREVVRLLDHLDAHYRGERYRASGALRERACMAALGGASESRAASGS